MKGNGRPKRQHRNAGRSRVITTTHGKASQVGGQLASGSGKWAGASGLLAALLARALSPKK